MQVLSATEQSLEFAVNWSDTQRDRMVLVLDGPLQGTKVRGVLSSADGQGTPEAYEFAPVK
jgi:hypothetical protein